MSLAEQPKPLEIIDWDRMYREGRPPWETGRQAEELVRVLRQGLIPPGSALELGCGSGANAFCLAKAGFEVTALDSAPIAIERARRRAELETVPVHFVLDDVFEFTQSSEPFDLIYDVGFYHFIRHTDLDRLLDMLWRITRPGSFYLTLAGNTNEKAEDGPPQVSEHDIRCELGRLLDIVQLRSFRIESANRKKGYLGWSCLMKRPEGFS